MKLKQIIIAVFTLAITLSCTTTSKANNPDIYSKSDEYVIKVKVKGLKDSVAYLANYVGKNIYYYDTAVVENETFTFRKKDIPHGVYAIIASLKPKPVYFDILINEKKISLETDINNIIPSMKIHKSKENKLFFGYINELQSKSMKKAPLMATYKTLDKIKDSIQIKKLSKQINEIDKSVLKFQKDFAKTNKDLLVGKLMGMSIEIDIPEAPKGTENARAWKYEYYKNHFFDNIDLKDDRLGRTVLFSNQIQQYFTKVIPQIPDTIIYRLDQFLNKLNPEGPMMKHSIEYLTYVHIKTKIMGMDAVYVHMADNYILNGRSSWIGKEKQDKIRPKVNKMRPTLLGKIAPNVILTDTTEKKWIGLHEIKSDYTLLIFWSDDCGHCKKEIPKYKKFYDSIKQNTTIKLETYAVCTHLENAGWRKFVRENNLDWINVSDFPDLRETPENYIFRTVGRNGKAVQIGHTDLKSINFRNSYDVFVTPIAFLLDKDKKIIAKQFDVHQLAGLLNHHIEIAKEKNK